MLRVDICLQFKRYRQHPMSTKLSVVIYQINFGQVIFTIVLTQLYQKFGPLFFGQLKNQAMMIAQQTANLWQQLNNQQDRFIVSGLTMPAIIMVGTTPYISLEYLYPQLSTVDHLAASINIQGASINPWLRQNLTQRPCGSNAISSGYSWLGSLACGHGGADNSFTFLRIEESINVRKEQMQA